MDYRKMWKDLGMDVENHDNLCAALPVAFTDVYLSQKNRPEGMAFWDTVVADIHGIRPSELVEERKKGRKVFGTFCVYVPDEVVVALNGIVTGLCGGSEFWVPDGEKVLPKSMCPLVKASLGAYYGKTCPFYRVTDLFVGETTCDGKKKAYEIMGKDAPFYIIDMPQMKRKEDVVKLAEEYKKFAAKAEEVTGNKLTLEKLNNAIKIINAKRSAIERVYNARKCATNFPISGKDALLMIQIAFFDDPERCASMCNKLADELEERNKNNVSVFPKGTKRIMLTGTPLAIPNWKLHHIIESNGGAVVCEEMCTGTRYFENLVKEDNKTLDEAFMSLAERYMKNNCACFTPNTGRFDDVKRLVKEYHVDGVIDSNLKFCTTYDTEGIMLEDDLKKSGIKCLGIETDYNDGDAGQLTTRIQAFLEML